MAAKGCLDFIQSYRQFKLRSANSLVNEFEITVDHLNFGVGLGVYFQSMSCNRLYPKFAFMITWPLTTAKTSILSLMRNFKIPSGNSRLREPFSTVDSAT